MGRHGTARHTQSPITHSFIEAPSFIHRGTVRSRNRPRDCRNTPAVRPALSAPQAGRVGERSAVTALLWERGGGGRVISYRFDRLSARFLTRFVNQTFCIKSHSWESLHRRLRISRPSPVWDPSGWSLSGSHSQRRARPAGKHCLAPLPSQASPPAVRAQWATRLTEPHLAEFGAQSGRQGWPWRHSQAPSTQRVRSNVWLNSCHASLIAFLPSSPQVTGSNKLLPAAQVNGERKDCSLKPCLDNS